MKLVRVCNEFEGFGVLKAYRIVVTGKVQGVGFEEACSKWRDDWELQAKSRILKMEM